MTLWILRTRPWQHEIGGRLRRSSGLLHLPPHVWLLSIQSALLYNPRQTKWLHSQLFTISADRSSFLTFCFRVIYCFASRCRQRKSMISPNSHSSAGAIWHAIHKFLAKLIGGAWRHLSIRHHHKKQVGNSTSFPTKQNNRSLKIRWENLMLLDAQGTAFSEKQLRIFSLRSIVNCFCALTTCFWLLHEFELCPDRQEFWNPWITCDDSKPSWYDRADSKHAVGRQTLQLWRPQNVAESCWLPIAMCWVPWEERWIGMRFKNRLSSSFHWFWRHTCSNQLSISLMWPMTGVSRKNLQFFVGKVIVLMSVSNVSVIPELFANSLRMKI